MHKTRAYNDRPAFWYPEVMPDDKDTTLVIAGDLGIGTSWIEYCRFSWITEISKQFKQVIIVLGNHDYWTTLTIKHGGKRCNDMLYDMGLHNVRVLDRSTFEDEGILFVGCTLWTDMDKGDPLAMYNMPKFMSYDGSIAYETGPNGRWDRFTSDRWVMEHDRHRNYIKHVVEQNRDKKIVVVTHHIPLTTLCDPAFAGDMSNAYYASDLSDLILDNPQIAVWAFGHTHSHSDTMFGETRMINNCAGYKGQNFERLGLVKHEVVEI